ncbi:MAG: hypothetical protein U0Z26_11595 [Anaerolineales bacterium]
MKEQSSLFRRIVIAALVLIVSGQACTFSLINLPSLPGSPTQTPVSNSPTATPYPAAQTTFIVTLPEPLQPGETLALDVLDEVTGLPYNPTHYPLTARDALTYTGTLPLPYNSVVKYRYVRRGVNQILEDSSLGTPIRYRMHYVIGPGDVSDIIADWADKSYSRPLGIIEGKIFNTDTGSPLPNILVSAGGNQSITDSTGHFELKGMPVGTHNLIAYSMDGLYQPFEQGAAVGDGQVTQVDMRVKPSQLVNVTFRVAIPSNTVPGVPVRIAGNILQLGNTFADLQSGLNTSTDRMPILSLQPDGKYAATLSLPVGTHIQYKYTLGDGFWNAEHSSDGNIVLRDLFVPAQNITLEDTVNTWNTGNSAPILFEVTVPSTTPAGDIIYIQLNTFTWSEPIPMWPLGNNRWGYKLYSPPNTLGSFGYRYCRNGQCGSADDNETSAPNSNGRQAITSLTEQDIQDSISSWKWLDNPEPVTLVGATITPRTAGFMAGVEFQPTYRPNWSYYEPQAFTNIQALGANQVVITPSWTYSSSNPLTFATVPGQDPLWIDSAIMISQARTLGLNVAIFPTPNFSVLPTVTTTSSITNFWMNAPKDAQWWQTWLTRYRAFAINYADLATQTGSQTLILGGDWVTPALPGGKLPDGTPSNAPADIEAQWKSIIAEVRTHFNGKIYWALPYTPSSLSTPFSFLSDVDGIYLLWSAKLAVNPSATKTDYANEAGRILDNEVAPLGSVLNKPIIIAASYPSAAGIPGDCVANGQGGCATALDLSRPNPDNSAVSLNLQAQADVYEALLNAINARPWIAGFVSRGYYPPAALQDKSASIHNKPAADILWYWYPRLLGAIK